MIPCYSAESDMRTIEIIREKLKLIETNADLKCRSVTETTIAFYFEAYDLEKIWFKNKSNNCFLNIKGLKKIIIDEKSGSSAYHVPQGILYRYGLQLNEIDEKFLDNKGNLLTHNIKELIEKTIS